MSDGRYEVGRRSAAAAFAAEFERRADSGHYSEAPAYVLALRHCAELARSAAQISAAELARQRQDGPDRPSAPSGVSPDAGPGKSALSVSPRSCMWCLWDITQVSGEGAWRLAWWSRSDEAEVTDPYHCDGHADGVHVPKAEAAPA